ncbi:MAG: glycosyltransferase [Anaerolineae bacterium]
MLISVVVPAFNEEEWIEACVRSLMNQDYPRHLREVIVVDNSSSDRTAEIARAHGARVVREPERGVARARQRGAIAARGQILAGTDADTIAPRDWLRRIAQAFAAEPDLIAITGPLLLHDGTSAQRWLTENVLNAWLRLNCGLGRYVFTGNNYAVRSEVYWNAGGFDTSLLSGEDTDLARRISRHGKVRFDSRVRMSMSSRRIKEGYGNLVLRTWPEFVRVVLLGREPQGGDFAAIR